MVSVASGNCERWQRGAMAAGSSSAGDCDNTAGDTEEPSQPDANNNPNPSAPSLHESQDQVCSLRRLESPAPSAGIVPPLPEISSLPRGFASAQPGFPSHFMDSPLPATCSRLQPINHQQATMKIPRL